MPQPFSLTGGNMKYSGVGGQAVMEGVMMKNEDRYAVAVRKPDHTIDVKVSTFKETIKNKKLRRLPFIRGVINFIESLILGMQTLMYSASFFEDDEDEKKKKEAMTQEERKAQEEKEKKQEKAMMGGTVAFSIVFALGLFFFLPYFLSGIFHKVISSDTVIALLEGLIRLAIFIGYIALISLTPDIKRVFMYHGAEHKCINCIEHGMELNVENVMKSSREHKRCGTSFLLFVMIVSIIFFLFIRIESPIWRVVFRLLLIPVIAGVSFEFIRLAGKSENKLVILLSKPGMMLQKLTTREPDASMAEVAIASARRASLIRGSFPSLSSISALVATPTKVPKVSKISTKRKDNSTTIKLITLTPERSARKHCPNVFPRSVRSTKARFGKRE